MSQPASVVNRTPLRSGFRATGRGKYDYKQNGPNDLTVNLYNYDVEGDELKEDHKAYLRASVIPRLRAGGGVTIMGIADATGDVSYNQALSERRANKVLAFLRSEAGGGFAVNRVVGRGKSVAVNVTGKDHTENDYFRAVALRVWDKGAPPPPPNVPNVTTPLNFDLMPGATAGDRFNPLSVGEGVLSTGFSVAELISSAAWVGVVTALAPIVDLAFTIIGMILTYKRTRELARLNGWCSGFAQAMADMAYTYRDPKLDVTKQETWPALPRPTPHLEYNVPDSQLEGFNQQQRAGLREGCEEAYKAISNLDLHPKSGTGTRNGQQVTFMVTGKVLLAALYHSPKGAFNSTMEQINRKLREQGRGPWPVTD